MEPVLSGQDDVEPVHQQVLLADAAMEPDRSGRGDAAPTMATPGTTSGRPQWSPAAEAGVTGVVPGLAESLFAPQWSPAAEAGVTTPIRRRRWRPRCRNGARPLRPG